MRSKLLACVVAVAIALLPSCGLLGSCGDDDLRLAEAIPHFEGAQPEFSGDPESAGCAAFLEVEAQADEVLDHYRRVLEEDGWDVSIEEARVEGLEGMRVFDLTAGRGDATVTIALEEFEGLVSAAIRVDA